MALFVSELTYANTSDAVVRHLLQNTKKRWRRILWIIILQQDGKTVVTSSVFIKQGDRI